MNPQPPAPEKAHTALPSDMTVILFSHARVHKGLCYGQLKVGVNSVRDLGETQEILCQLGKNYYLKIPVSSAKEIARRLTICAKIAVMEARDKSSTLSGVPTEKIINSLTA